MLEGITPAQVILLLIAGIITFFFWSIKAAMTRSEVRDDKFRELLDKQAKEHRDAYSVCREDILDRMDKKADRAELTVVHGRLDAQADKLSHVEGYARGVEMTLKNLHRPAK